MVWGNEKANRTLIYIQYLGVIMSHVKHLLMSCLLALTASSLQAAEPMPAAKLEAPTQQPVSPLTITIKQIGEASWKTFYRVPVEVNITNNQAHDFNLGAPYVANISLWNADMLRYKAAKLFKALGFTCIGLSLLSIPAEGIKSLMNIALSYKGVEAPAFGFHCCPVDDGRHVCSSYNSPVISFMQDAFAPGLANIALAVGLIILGTTRHCIKPHETVTITGLIGTADIKKIQNSPKTHAGNAWQFIPLA